MIWCACASEATQRYRRGHHVRIRADLPGDADSRPLRASRPTRRAPVSAGPGGCRALHRGPPVTSLPHRRRPISWKSRSPTSTSPRPREPPMPTAGGRARPPPQPCRSGRPNEATQASCARRTQHRADGSQHRPAAHRCHRPLRHQSRDRPALVPACREQPGSLHCRPAVFTAVAPDRSARRRARESRHLTGWCLRFTVEAVRR